MRKRSTRVKHLVWQTILPGYEKPQCHATSAFNFHFRTACMHRLFWPNNSLDLIPQWKCKSGLDVWKNQEVVLQKQLSTDANVLHTIVFILANSAMREPHCSYTSTHISAAKASCFTYNSYSMSSILSLFHFVLLCNFPTVYCLIKCDYCRWLGAVCALTECPDNSR